MVNDFVFPIGVCIIFFLIFIVNTSKIFLEEKKFETGSLYLVALAVVELIIVSQACLEYTAIPLPPKC